MRIKINTVEAIIIDASTMSENDFMIADWVVKYEVSFPPLRQTHIDGVLKIESDIFPDLNLIIKYIQHLYNSVEEELKKEPLIIRAIRKK